MLEFRILGPLDVSEGSDPCPLHGPRERALLAYLLLHANHVVSTDRIIDDLWGDEPPRTVGSMLHVYVSRLRKVVNRNGNADTGLFTQAPGYVLRIAPEQLDLHRFESLSEAGKQSSANGEYGAAAQQLRAALALWRGRPLADLADHQWAGTEIARLEEARLATLEERIEADLQLGRHGDVTPELQKLVSEHPLREGLVAQLMVALYRSGRQGEALTVYDAARRRLASELGLEPGTTIKRLQRAILDQDPELELRAAHPTPPASRRPRLRWILAAAAVVGGGTAAAAVLVPQSSSAPRALAKAPSESVAVVDAATNRLVDAIPVGGRISGIDAGYGSVWVGDVDGKALLRIDPATARVVQTIALPATPTDVAAGLGAVWVTSASAHLLLRIDPQYGVIDRRIHLHQKAWEQGTASEAPVTAGPGGLWVGHDVSALTRIDPVRGTVVEQLRLDESVGGLSEGAGAVWVLTSGTPHLLSVDPIANTVGTSTPTGGWGGQVAVGGGAVWAGDAADDRVWRIDPRTRKPTAIVVAGNYPWGIAFGSGSVWVADGLGGTLSRIDPRTNRVGATINLGNNPQEVAVARGRVWVTVP